MAFRTQVCRDFMLHHVNKDGGQRGTSAREDNLDTSIMLKSPHDYTPEDGARFIVHFSKARVSTNKLNLIGNTEFKLILDEIGNHTWTFKNVRQSVKIEVIKMIDDGLDQKTIAENLNVSKGYVSQLKKQAVKDGWLSAKGKLTPTGFEQVSAG